MRRFFHNQWKNIPRAPPDPIMGLTELYMKSNNPNKINLSVGAYRDENGNPYIFDSVKIAKSNLYNQSYNYEYLPILGCDTFNYNSLKLVMGDYYDIENYSKTQTISGTGALKIAAVFLNEFMHKNKIYLPKPTWSNHNNIFSKSGFEIKHYNYLSEEMDIDNDNIINTLKTIPDKSVVLFHVCCHNPTGIDPNMNTWNIILDCIRDKGHIVVFDMAYQGFATGDVYNDSRVIRKAADFGINFLLCQSYSKNFGLYGERIGCLSINTINNKDKTNVESQLKQIIRPMYSNPPVNGSRIINEILTNNVLKQMWLDDCNKIFKRMNETRVMLHEKLVNNLPNNNWKHILKQKGMFSYTGINENSIKKLKNDHDIFMTNDGRISITSLNKHNIDYFISSLSKTMK